MAEGKTLQIKRGLASTIGTLAAGELGFTTDTEVLYIGDGATNHPVAMASQVDGKADAFISVHQHSHGLVVGDVIYCSGANTYTKAKADLAATCNVVGIVSSSTGIDDFIFCTFGKMTTGVPAEAAGTVLFLSDVTAGLLTSTEPTLTEHISIPMAVITENAVSMIVFPWRGVEISAGISGGGDVTGAASSSDGNLAVFNGITGKIIKDGGIISSAGLELINDANAAAQLVTLGLTDVTATELGYVHDVTSAIQTQLNAKLPLAGGTLSGDIVLGENTAVALDPSASADEKWSGITVSGTAGETLAVGDLCYLQAAAGEWMLADADTAASAGPVVLGICILAGGNAEATKMLLMGTVRSAAFPASIALGAAVYVSATAGDITETAPSTATQIVRIVGHAVTVEPNTIYFAPDNTWIEV